MKYIILLISIILGCEQYNVLDPEPMDETQNPYMGTGNVEKISYFLRDIKLQYPDGIIPLDTIQNAIRIHVSASLLLGAPDTGEQMAYYELDQECFCVLVDYERTSEWVNAIIVRVVR